MSLDTLTGLEETCLRHILEEHNVLENNFFIIMDVVTNL